MIHLTRKQMTFLKHWFLPERPGPLIGSHVIQTSHGICLVNRWPEPQVVLVETAGNYTLVGDAQALNPADLQPHIKGFVDTDDAFAPLLRAAFSDVQMWPRVIFAQPEAPAPAAVHRGTLRRLEPSDAQRLAGLSAASAWISKTWEGHERLAASGCAWGAFVDGQLASVACTFFMGETYEEIGVVTEPTFQRLGLSTACAGALCRDIWTRGHRPSWTTSPDNIASIRVAEKLGFTVQRHDQLYVVGIPIPEPVSRSQNGREDSIAL